MPYCDICHSYHAAMNPCRRSDSESTACSAAAPEGGSAGVGSSNPDAVASAARSAVGDGSISFSVAHEALRTIGHFMKENNLCEMTSPMGDTGYDARIRLVPRNP